MLNVHNLMLTLALVVLIWKKVYFADRYLLLKSYKKIENMVFETYILQNSKNQNFNKFIIKGKTGICILAGVSPYIVYCINMRVAMNNNNSLCYVTV